MYNERREMSNSIHSSGYPLPSPRISCCCFPVGKLIRLSERVILFTGRQGLDERGEGGGGGVGKGWLPNRGRGWTSGEAKKSRSFDVKWILEEASGGPRGLVPARFSNCSAPPSSPRCRLPFDFHAFPLCYRLSLCACRPWRGKGLSLSVSL